MNILDLALSLRQMDEIKMELFLVSVLSQASQSLADGHSLDPESILDLFEEYRP